MREGKDAAFRYINDYSRRHYDRITILVPKGCKALIQNAAAEAKMTTSEFIVSRIPIELIAKEG